MSKTRENGRLKFSENGQFGIFFSVFHQINLKLLKFLKKPIFKKAADFFI
jgi:hypothetical protein